MDIWAEDPSRIERRQLKPGDHIYAWRRSAGNIYSHHGIYESDNKVIHFIMDTPSQEQPSLAKAAKVVLATAAVTAGAVAVAVAAAAAAAAAAEAAATAALAGGAAVVAAGGGPPVYALSSSWESCWACRLTMRHGGVVSCCLDCFLKGDNICVFAYSVPSSRFYGESAIKLMVNRALLTCATQAEDPPETVLRRANDLLASNGFGSYHPLDNNCFDFAFYCKTGRRFVPPAARQREDQTCMIL